MTIGRYASMPISFVRTAHTESLMHYNVYVFENLRFFGLHFSEHFLLKALKLFKCGLSDNHEMLEGTKLKLAMIGPSPLKEIFVRLKVFLLIVFDGFRSHLQMRDVFDWQIANHLGSMSDLLMF